MKCFKRHILEHDHSQNIYAVLYDKKINLLTLEHFSASATFQSIREALSQIICKTLTTHQRGKIDKLVSNNETCFSRGQLSKKQLSVYSLWQPITHTYYLSPVCPWRILFKCVYKGKDKFKAIIKEMWVQWYTEEQALCLFFLLFTYFQDLAYVQFHDIPLSSTNIPLDLVNILNSYLDAHFLPYIIFLLL